MIRVASVIGIVLYFVRGCRWLLRVASVVVVVVVVAMVVFATVVLDAAAQ